MNPFDVEPSIVLPKPHRTTEQQFRYGEYNEAKLKTLWGRHYDRNLRLVTAYIDKKLQPHYKEALANEKNRDGFLIGSDIRYIVKMYENAKAEMTSSEKKAATKYSCFKGTDVFN